MIRFTLALALMAGVAIAPAPGMAMEPYLPRNPKTFSKTDADANGKVTAAELRPFAEKRFARLDKDRNGAVSAAEIDEALLRSLERRRGRILAKLDADKDAERLGSLGYVFKNIPYFAVPGENGKPTNRQLAVVDISPAAQNQIVETLHLWTSTPAAP